MNSKSSNVERVTGANSNIFSPFSTFQIQCTDFINKITHWFHSSQSNMDPSSQYISLEMLDLTKQSDALQISSMFPKFQMHVIVQELILSDYDVNKTVDVLLNKTDEIVDNRASSSSTRSPVTTNQLPRSPSVKKTISNTSENTIKTKKSSPPSYEETLRMLDDDSAIISKSRSKKCTKISTEISKSNTKINPKIDSKSNKSYPKFTTVQNKQLI